jgi:hypothetical protein
MDNKTNSYKKQYNKNEKKYREKKERKPVSEQTYRFRRVLGDILKHLKSLPHASAFNRCQNEYGSQLTELIQKGFTWGYSYPIPVHDSDFIALQKKEWAAIRAIVRKQEYTGANPDY